MIARLLRLSRIVAPLLIGVGACGSPLDPLDARALRDAEARWKSHGIHSYTFEMRSGCFCPPEITEWAIVEVRDGEIVEARSTSGVLLTGIALTSRKTVDGLFAEAKADYSEWVARVDLEFDDELGYPTRMVFAAERNILDAGVVYEARNLITRN